MPVTRFVVAGSLNYDLLTYVARLPRAGEAMPAREMRRDLGGKGFNQAVALRRLGAEVRMVGAVGSDPFGASFGDRLDELRIDRRWVLPVGAPTGLAVRSRLAGFGPTPTTSTQPTPRSVATRAPGSAAKRTR